MKLSSLFNGGASKDEDRDPDNDDREDGGDVHTPSVSRTRALVSLQVDDGLSAFPPVLAPCAGITMEVHAAWLRSTRTACFLPFRHWLAAFFWCHIGWLRSTPREAPGKAKTLEHKCLRMR